MTSFQPGTTTQASLTEHCSIWHTGGTCVDHGGQGLWGTRFFTSPASSMHRQTRRINGSGSGSRHWQSDRVPQCGDAAVCNYCCYRKACADQVSHEYRAGRRLGILGTRTIPHAWRAETNTPSAPRIRDSSEACCRRDCADRLLKSREILFAHLFHTFFQRPFRHSHSATCGRDAELVTGTHAGYPVRWLKDAHADRTLSLCQERITMPQGVAERRFEPAVQIRQLIFDCCVD